MISKSLSASEKFALLVQDGDDLHEFCQALYPLIVSHTDDFGRLQGDPYTVKTVCHPSSPRSKEEFVRALQLLHAVQLIGWYYVDGRWFIEIVDFEKHQQGLHKRTRSHFPKFPGFSTPGNFPEFPHQLKGRELNRRELKRRELKKERTDPANSVQAEPPSNGSDPMDHVADRIARHHHEQKSRAIHHAATRTKRLAR